MQPDHEVAAPYLLRLEPILMQKVWGGRRLESLGKTLPSDDTYGESWEVADLESTSPSGGGGNAARSVVTNGKLAGRTLNEVLELWGADLVGRAWVESTDFPLLVKLLDAREHLSVQVHPTPEYAAAHPGAHVKSESWFIIDAAPDATLYLGLAPGADRAEVRDAVAQGRTSEVLRAVPAVPGDCHHLPSGTVHALGAGIVVAEIQSPSDTTFRLYDWTAEHERPERPLHVDEALECVLIEPPPSPTHVIDGHIEVLATTERYRLRGARSTEPFELQTETAAVVLCVAGTATVTHDDQAETLTAGSTIVVPAATSGATVVDGTHATVLVAELA